MLLHVRIKRTLVIGKAYEVLNQDKTQRGFAMYRGEHRWEGVNFDVEFYYYNNRDLGLPWKNNETKNTDS